MNSTVTIALSEYKKMEKRLARKKDELISVGYDTYYGTKKQKELVIEMQEHKRQSEEELRKKFSECTAAMNRISHNYKKSIRNLYIAL